MPSTYSPLMLQLIWQKAHPIPGKDPVWLRADDYGREIAWTKYGDRTSSHGWEVDHITPVALGGSDDLRNLRPLHWRPNAMLGSALARALARQRPA